MSSEIRSKSATELSRLIHARKLSATEVMSAFLERIREANPKVNAICTFIGEQEAMRLAAEADAVEPLGPLHGLPHAVKDLVLTRGIRTTFGSPIYKDFVPTQDALIVERLKNAGALIIGKTNTPEFGAGSQTFNEVFGATRNPYDLTKTCGGSSGGAAVALATGMLPLADGSDLGGSLRNPASFCNVVGFRPSAGRVPTWPTMLAWNTLTVEGPMARSVQDAAFLLAALAGPDPRVPISITEPGSLFRRPLDRDFKGTRIAWSQNLGRYPVEPVVTQVCDTARQTFLDLGCRVDDAQPSIHEAAEIFHVIRAWQMAETRREDYRQFRHLMKDTVIWNIEQGMELTGEDISSAEVKRAGVFQRMREFFEHYDFLVLPVSQVAPFPLETKWVREINGTKMESYIDWMGTCSAITVTGSPAISVPCGFTPGGLPVGLQIVGPYRHDFEVLQLAHAFETARGAQPGILAI